MVLQGMSCSRPEESLVTCTVAECINSARLATALARVGNGRKPERNGKKTTGQGTITNAAASQVVKDGNQESKRSQSIANPFLIRVYYTSKLDTLEIGNAT